MIPRSHPVHPELSRAAAPSCAAWATRCASWSRTLSGDIFDPQYSDTLRKIHDELFLTPGRRPRLGQVAVGAGRALDRGHRGGLPRRPGDARQLRRLAPRRPKQLRANIARAGHRRQPGRQRLQVEHDRRAAARQRPARPASASTYRALSHAIEQDPRRASRPTASTRVHVDRLRQAGRRPDRRPDAGGAVLRAWPR